MAKPLRGMRKRGRVWYGRLTNARGQRVERRLSENLEAAVTIFKQLNAQADLERVGLDSHARQRAVLELVLDAFLEDLRGRASARHVENVELVLKWWKSKLVAKTVGDLRADEVLRLRSSLTVGKAARSNRTANRYADALRSALTWAKKAGLVAENPLASLEKLPEKGKHQKRVRARLTVEETDKLVRASRAYDEANEHQVPQAPLVELILDSGLRLTEATSLEWRDVVEVKTGVALRVRAENAKTGVARNVPVGDLLTPDRLARLRAVQGRHLGRLPGPRDRVLLSPRGKPWTTRANQGNALRWLNARLAEAKVEKVRDDGSSVDWHALRHTYCTQLFEAGVPVEVVCRLMGHSDISTTWAVYTDWSRVPTDSAIEKLGEHRRKQRGNNGASEETAS